MYCPKCGNKISSKDKICPYCGEWIDDDVLYEAEVKEKAIFGKRVLIAAGAVAAAAVILVVSLFPKSDLAGAPMEQDTAYMQTAEVSGNEEKDNIIKEEKKESDSKEDKKTETKKDSDSEKKEDNKTKIETEETEKETKEEKKETTPEPEAPKQEAQEPEVTKPEVQEPVVQQPEVQEPEVQQPSAEQPEVQESAAQQSQPAQEQVQEPAVDDRTFTMEEAEAIFAELFQQALGYCRNGNYEGFSGMFTLISDQAEVEQLYYDIINEYIPAGYPDTTYMILMGDGRFFLGSVLNSVTTGAYPNSVTKTLSTDMELVYINGEWKFDLSSEGQAIFDSFDDAVLTEEALNAKNAGRNFTCFNKGDYSYLFSDVVFENVLKADLYVMWQNGDGSVSCLLNIKNGTGGTRTINTVNLKATDSAAGVIFDYQFEFGATISPGTSGNCLITIPAEQVLSGTAVWSQIEYEVNYTSV